MPLDNLEEIEKEIDELDFTQPPQQGIKSLLNRKLTDERDPETLSAKA